MTIQEYSDAIDQAATALCADITTMVQLMGETAQSILKIDNETASSDPAIFGLQYMEQDPELKDGRQRYGYFAPMYEFPNGVYPRPVSVTSDADIEQWKSLAAAVHEPHSKARYADLLWERLPRSKESSDYARLAIESYIEFASSDWPSGLDRRIAAGRAYELAKTLRDKDAISKATTVMLDIATTDINSDDAAPGIGLPLLELIAKDTGATMAAEIAPLIATAIEKFGTNAYAVESIHEIQAAITPKAELKDIRRDQVQYLLDEAVDLPDGLVKVVRLHAAEAAAQQYGFNDLVDKARSFVEAIPFDSLDMRSTTFSAEVPRKAIDDFAAKVTGNDSLENALKRLGGTSALRDFASNQADVENIAANHPMLMFFTDYNMGPANSLIKAARTREEKLGTQLSQVERDQIINHCLPVAVSVSMALKHYGATKETLAAALTSEFIGADDANVLAKGIMQFLGGDGDTATKCLAPAVERLIREMAQKGGIPTTELPNDSTAKSGGVKGLGAILGKMQGFMDDEDLRRYWRNALTDNDGYNLRNRVGHGLNIEFTEYDAAVLIHIICTIRVMTLEKRETHE